ICFSSLFRLFLVLVWSGGGVALAPVLVVVGGLLPLHVLHFLAVKVVIARKLHALQALLSGLGMSLYVLAAGEQLAADVAAEGAHT
uniref:Si:dkeyp-34f6.4 n=1 Tax=Xiphophorus couchianus TaxID=32473 RepID=A0A3B5MSX0_9TELE